MTFKQSNIKCIRTFKSWYYEYKIIVATLTVLLPNIDTKLSVEQAKMYYNGGYSVKMVIHEVNKIPLGEDIL